MRTVDRRMAARLVARGWTVVPPAPPHSWQEFNVHGNTCAYPGCNLTEDEHLNWSPCAQGCPDPARHAEGGHDV